MEPGVILETLRVYFPQQTLYLLLDLPLPVDGEREDKGEHQEAPEDPGRDLRHPLPPLAFLLLVAARGLVQGLEPLGPVEAFVEGVFRELLVEESSGVGGLVVVVAVPAEPPNLHQIVAASEHLAAEL